MSHDAQDLSRRDLIRIGATGVAAASIAGLPATADEKAAPTNCRSGDTAAPGLRSAGSWARPTGRRN